MTNPEKPQETQPYLKKSRDVAALRKAHEGARATAMSKSRGGFDALKSDINQPKSARLFPEEIRHKKGAERERAIYAAVMKEGLPEFQEVATTMKSRDGREHKVVIRITKRALNINGMGIPMTQETAELIAEKTGCMLPTAAIMKAVFEDPKFKKLVMPTLPPGPSMTSTEYYEQHNRMILEQMRQKGINENGAVIGAEKTICAGPKNTSRLLLHGGLRPDGRLYQNNTLTPHSKRYYVDYSQRARLVDRKIVVDDKEMDIEEARKRYPGLIEFNPYGLEGVAKAKKPRYSRAQKPPLRQKFAISPNIQTTPKKAPRSLEGHENIPPIGATFFAGDSNMVNTPRNINVAGKKETLAQVGKTSDWLLGKMRESAKNGVLADFENFVCLIGTNDIGGPKSAKQIFENIRAICRIARENGIKNLYICTIPPFKGFGNYARRYAEINEKRNEINQFIVASGQFGDFKVIPLHTLVSDRSDGYETLSKKFDAGDHLHLQKYQLAKLLQKEVSGEAAA